jgi:hypothetical protein
MARWSDVAGYLQDRFDSLNVQSMAAHGWAPGGTHRLDVVIASVDKGMLHRWYPDPQNDNKWHVRWERRGGAFASRAALANSRNDTLMAFALGLDGELNVAGVFGGDLNAVNAGDWPHASVGRPHNDRLISHPTAVTDGDHVRVYVRAESGTIWAIVVDHNANVTENWHEAYKEGIPRRRTHKWTYAPAAASWGPGRIDLFTVDEGSSPYSDDNSLWHAWYESNSRGPDWEELGISGLSSSPDAAVWPRTDQHPLGAIYMMACGAVYDIQGPSFAFASWLGQHWAYRWLHPRGAVADGTIASWGQPRLDLFYIKDTFRNRSNGTRKYVAGHAWYNGDRWGPESAWSFDDTDFEAATYPVAPWNGLPI